MKSIKGIILVISISLLAVADIKADSGTDKIKDNIFNAIYSIDYTSINVLLSDGTDIDTVDQEGNTPLMVASKVGNTRILDIILSHNPDINKKNNNGTTALMIAAQTGQNHVVKKLVKHGANLSDRDQDGNTATKLAARFGHEEIVQFFKRSKMQAPLAK